MNILRKIVCVVRGHVWKHADVDDYCAIVYRKCLRCGADYVNVYWR